MKKLIPTTSLHQSELKKVEWINPQDPTQKVAHGKIDRAAQEALWNRALAILYSAGVIDDTGIDDLQRLWQDSISDAYVQRKLKEAIERDDTGRLKQTWKEQQETIREWINTGLALATFVLTVLTFIGG